MASPTPDQFWLRVAESKLVDTAAIGTLRREFEGLPFPPGAGAAEGTKLVARWLVKRGVLSDWQARRLLHGEAGPFFLGEYRLLDRFETGRGGTVFRARHDPTGRAVAITVLNNKLCQEAEVWSDLLRRTKIATAAADPTLTRTWALERVGSQRFVLSEDVPGVALADELAKRGPLPAGEAGEIVLAVARAVAELHRRGAVHGGVSLDTVRREAAPPGSGTTTGAIRLLQFPLVADPHVVPPRLELKSAEALERLGSRASFLAPEWLREGRICDTTGDVYALGCLFHALLAGSPPAWQGDAQRTLAHLAGGQGAAPLSSPGVPLEVATLVSYLMARSPADRYPTAVEAADAIAACLGRPAVSPGLPAACPLITPGSGPGGDEGEPDVAAAVALVDTAPAPRRTAPPVRRRPAWMVPSLVGACLLAGAGVTALLLIRPATPRAATGARSTADSAPAPDDGASMPIAARGGDDEGAADGDEAATGRRPGATSAPVGTTLVDARGSEQVPYDSPQPAGAPPQLRYLPPGSQLILLARPAAALATDEGELFVRALGPRAAGGLERLARIAGTDARGIEEIQAGWQAGGPDEAIGAALVRGVAALPTATDAGALQAAVGPTDVESYEGETLHRAATFTVWFPSDADHRAVMVGPDGLVRDTVAAHRAAGSEGLEAALPPDLETLVGMLDSTRHVTLLGSPDYLVHDGRAILAGPLAKTVEPLSRFFGDAVRAAAISLHFGDDAYVEIDAVAPAGTPTAQLVKRLSGGITALADSVEEYCNALDPHPYGRKLVMRLPRMLGVVADQTHAGAEGRGVVVNAWLPRHAPHNIALAAELALEQVPRAGGPAVAAPTVRAPSAKGALDALARPIALVFVKDTLEKSIQMISEEIGVEMEILGSDLQLEGITKNQSFGLEERNRPAVDILRTILAKANPDGKLVYVVRSGPNGERIEITTRAAAQKRGDTLPPGQEAGGSAEQENR